MYDLHFYIVTHTSLLAGPVLAFKLHICLYSSATSKAVPHYISDFIQRELFEVLEFK